MEKTRFQFLLTGILDGVQHTFLDAGLGIIADGRLEEARTTIRHLSVLTIRPTVEIRLRRLRRAAGCTAANWTPLYFAWISLFTERNSLFRITGNLTLQLRKRSGISDLIRSGGPDIGEIPCIFPA